MAYAKTLREKLGRVGADIEALLATGEQQGYLTSEQREKYHALEKDFTSVEDDIKIAEGGSRLLASLASPDNPGRISDLAIEQLRDEFRMSPAEKRRREREQDPYARAFSAYLRVGMNDLEPDARQMMAKRYLANTPGTGPTGLPIQAAQSTATGAGGGYIVPTGFSDTLEEAKKWFGGIAGVVDSFKTETGNPWPWPTVNDTANKGRIIGQNVQVTETDLAFGQITFNAYIGSSDLILIPLALMQDAYFDLDALVARLLGTRLGRLYNWKCTVGSGTNEPTGIVTAAVAAGNVLTLGAGNTASISYNNIVDLEHSVDPAYRFNPGTYFMFSDAELKLLKKLVDGNNRPLWQPGLTASFREGSEVDLLAAKPTILDHPFIINQDMATPAANAYSALFGDANTFKVREVVGGTTVLRLTERYADYLQVGFTAFQRFDSNLIDAGTHPIAVLQQSAT